MMSGGNGGNGGHTPPLVWLGGAALTAGVGLLSLLLDRWLGGRWWALGCVLTISGALLVGPAWWREWRRNRPVPVWLPTLAGSMAMAATIGLWWGYQLLTRQGATPQALASVAHHRTHDVILVMGLLLSLATFLAGTLARTAQQRALVTERHRRQLEREVGERRHAEALLRQEQRLFMAGPVVVFLWRNAPGWPVEYVSPNVEQFGHRAESLLNGQLPYTRLIHPDDLARVGTEVEHHTREGREGFERDYRLVGRNGEVRWITDYTRILRNKRGEVTHYQGYILDITGRKQAEERLHTSEQQLRTILDTTTEGFWHIDPVTKETRAVNPALCRMLGYTREEMVGRTPLAFVDEENRRIFREQTSRIQSTDHRSYQITLQTKSGAGVHTLFNASTLRGSSGESVAAFAFVTDITHQQETARELARAKEAADAANRAKSHFLATMSHEIRTPLNVLLGMGELLAESPLSAEQREWLSISNRSGTMLLALINNVLDLSKIEAGELVLEEAPLAPRELVEETVAVLAPQARDKGLTLTWRVDPAVPHHLMGDQQRLRQVLLNLVNNAIKFTPSGTVAVQVAPAPHGPGISATVEDSGPGVPPELRERIFHPFTQGDASTTRRHGGTGLGLTICRQLVERMGGEITVAEAPGQGSRFSFTIPLAEAHPLASPRIHQPSGEPTPLPLEAFPALGSEAPGAGRFQVLLVDDSEDNRLLVQAFLKHAPYQVATAADGAEALRQFTRQRFHVVLMDMQMPVMDGYTAVAEIRQWERRQGRHPTPVIALTAHAMREDRQRTRQAGCDHHLSKPIRKRQLLELLGQCCPSPGMARERRMEPGMAKAPPVQTGKRG